MNRVESTLNLGMFTDQIVVIFHMQSLLLVHLTQVIQLCSLNMNRVESTLNLGMFTDQIVVIFQSLLLVHLTQVILPYIAANSACISFH